MNPKSIALALMLTGFVGIALTQATNGHWRQALASSLLAIVNALVLA